VAKSKSDAKSEYARRLKAYRRAADVSQEHLAKALGVHQPYIAAIEAGKINIGLDKQEDIASFFGVKHYYFSNPQAAIPNREDLRESIIAYIKDQDIDPGYLESETPNYAKYIDLLLDTDYLRIPRTSREIAHELLIRFDVDINSVRVSDILSRAPRKDRIVVSRADKGNRNLYRLVRADKSGG